MRTIRVLVAVALLCLACQDVAVGGESSAAKPDDFAWIRGANYVPSYSRNDVQTWMDYDPAVIDRELGYAEKLQLNCVRVFLQVAVYEQAPQRFHDNFENLLSLCEKHHLKLMCVTDFLSAHTEGSGAGR